jgi:hypothetical protein
MPFDVLNIAVLHARSTRLQIFSDVYRALHASKELDPHTTKLSDRL